MAKMNWDAVRSAASRFPFSVPSSTSKGSKRTRLFALASKRTARRGYPPSCRCRCHQTTRPSSGPSLAVCKLQTVERASSLMGIASLCSLKLMGPSSTTLTESRPEMSSLADLDGLILGGEGELAVLHAFLRSHQGSGGRWRYR